MNYEDFKKITNPKKCPRCNSSRFEPLTRIIDFAPIVQCLDCGYEIDDIKRLAWVEYITERDPHA